MLSYFISNVMAFNRKAKLSGNIEAIRTAFLLDRESRPPTTQERVVLKSYCGFGGLKCILNPADELTDAVYWSKSDLELFAPTAELHKVIRENSDSPLQYKRYMDSLKASVLTAFYTPREITETLTTVFRDHNIVPDRILEPSAGSGVFIDAFSRLSPDAEIMAFEKDILTGKILYHLHHDQQVRIEGFEKIEKPFNNHFDAAVSNIPFGDIAVFDPQYSKSNDAVLRSATKRIHKYFFLKALDTVRDGGIVAFITSQGVLDAGSGPSFREELFRRADLVSALRLPQ